MFVLGATHASRETDDDPSALVCLVGLGAKSAFDPTQCTVGGGALGGGLLGVPCEPAGAV